MSLAVYAFAMVRRRKGGTYALPYLYGTSG
jgi:hypothetical protein